MINKTDLAPAVGADLAVMDRDSRAMRGDGPFVFAQIKHGVGLDLIAAQVLHAWRETAAAARWSSLAATRRTRRGGASGETCFPPRLSQGTTNDHRCGFLPSFDGVFLDVLDCSGNVLAAKKHFPLASGETLR